MTPELEAAATLAPTNGSGVSVSASGVSVTIPDASPDPDASTDESRALVERATQGDRAAFAALYRMYLPTVYKFLYYRTGNNKAVAEDMTAEVFLRALRKIGDFSWTGADFGSWLLRIARNLVLDNAKSSRARLEILNDEMPEAPARGAATAETQVIETITNEGVYAAIRKLSPDQRDVITMRFIQGMEVSAVAQAMGKKEGTIRTLQFRALRTLQKLLVRDGVVDGTDTRIRPNGVRLAQNGRGNGRTESEAARFGVAEGDR